MSVRSTVSRRVEMNCGHNAPSGIDAGEVNDRNGGAQIISGRAGLTYRVRGSS